jgi:hypothetical protein
MTMKRENVKSEKRRDKRINECKTEAKKGRRVNTESVNRGRWEGGNMIQGPTI